MSVEASVTVVVVFVLGVRGLARLEGTREQRGGASALGLAQATLCFLARTAVVAYGTPDRPPR
ncbi:hypothetical protein [Streptomyces sp. NPDC092370]|uniref:hypothetical protein n=1 Tax=Streptomyces sp. NPDC092370 TaxID=3366016 RepID=UPI003803CAD5